MTPRSLPLIALTSTLILAACTQVSGEVQPELGAGPGVTLITEGGRSFKDLNKNGALDPYEDWRLTPGARADHLISRMTLEEKAGVMMHGTAPTTAGGVGQGSSYDLTQATRMIRDEHVNTFITRLDGDPVNLATQNNRLQEIAEATRLGIPATISTDPRNSFQFVLGATNEAGQFSKWPETLGLAATRDPNLTRRMADVARQEYRAVGIQMALSPQADLATEPRWSRISGTFGEDAATVSAHVGAYVSGFQNGTQGINRNSVVTVVKHWGGYGAAREGFDGHNSYGKYADFSSGASYDNHLRAFQGAFDAGAAGVMPTYSILTGVTVNGQALEQVGAGFNRQLLQDELRGRYGFGGVIVSDWAIMNDCNEICVNGSPDPAERVRGIAMPWGVEHLSREDRYAKGVGAGLDQIGGTTDSATLISAVKNGKVTEARIGESVRRILVQKFEQGLFENPYVNARRAGEVVGNAGFSREADDAQVRSLVLLENKNDLLPLGSGVKKVYLYGVAPEAATAAGFTVVTTPGEADVAIIRAEAPFQTLHPNYFFGSRYHEGDLDFKDGHPAYEAFKAAAAQVPTILTVYLDRPAILTNVKDRAGALIGNFGVSDANLFRMLTGQARPEGKLPFELPSSMEAVRAQKPDLPSDSAAPLYPYGHGLALK
ncbi:glycoside hydrolase family 3 protein [Deinococcus aestuarii]|uniref:glycoside hydrolase family 3 protein n=1 Tax=Deinococcus aestuarii TaxID=2774531 RepID=UPI001C0C0DCC|nr:glycoside hydrolase family 3 N-terminal domain-containing protein [Deinococcus aestuarii]